MAETGTKTPEELAAEKAKIEGQSGKVDTNNLSPELQEIFSAGFRGGAEKIEGEVKTLKEQLAKNQKQMETLQATASLSEKEKMSLEESIADIKKQTQTKEQTQAEELVALKSTSAKEIAELKADRDLWQGTHLHNLIETEISNAAVEAKAWRPKQVVKMLYEEASVVEVIDETTKQLRGHKVEIRLPVEEDGKQIIKSFNAKDGVAAFLKENPNLLKSQLSPGAGAQGAQGFRTAQGTVLQKDFENPDNFMDKEKSDAMIEAFARGEVID